MGFRLTWAETNSNETEHRVYRSTATMDPSALPAPVAVLPDNTTTYDDGDVTEGTTYYYRVSAVMASGAELVSEELVVDAVESA